MSGRREERLEEFRKTIAQRLDNHEDLDDQRFGRPCVAVARCRGCAGA
jgi:hypothetical protein